MVAKGLVVIQRELLAAVLLSGAEITNGHLQEAEEDHHPRLSKREIAVLTAITDGLPTKKSLAGLGFPSTP